MLSCNLVVTMGFLDFFYGAYESHCFRVQIIVDFVFFFFFKSKLLFVEQVASVQLNIFSFFPNTGNIFLHLNR